MTAQTIQFIKMEGTANDYVFIDQLSGAGAWPADVDPDSQEGRELIQRLADRHRGVGGDGVVFIQPPRGSQALARMRMHNADGSSSAMCGNALRCIALFVRARGGPEQREFLLESDVGLHMARVLQFSGDEQMAAGRFEVDLGAPIFAPERVPFAPERAESFQGDGVHAVLSDVRLASDRTQLAIPPAVVLSMGNPHCVLFVDDADDARFEALGPVLENHPAFPERTNVEFVSIERIDRIPDGASAEAAADDPSGYASRLYQRTYERGTGETLSCGSGACAVHVAAVLTGRAQPVGRIRVRGGELELEWRGSVSEPSGVLMRGPARIVFRGELSL